MTLYEKYAKHLHDAVCSYRDVDLDVALYYAIAAILKVKSVICCIKLVNGFDLLGYS